MSEGHGLKVALVGDIMLGDHPVCFGHGIRSATSKTGIAPKLEHCRALLRRCDVAIGNLECVLAQEDGIGSDLKSREMLGRSSDAESLAEVGIRVLSVANNHAMQHGAAAFYETVATLRNVGIEPVGLVGDRGESNVVVLSSGQSKAAVIAYSLRPEHFVSPEECGYARGSVETIVSQVHDLRSEFDFVILCLHWGEEYLSYPSPEQMRIARRLADAGVTILVGHHPHVLQGMERIDSAVVFYSLGNFLFDAWRQPERESAIVSVQLSESSIVDVDIEPVTIGPDFAVFPCEGDRRQERLSEWQNLCQALQTAVSADEQAYSRVAEKAYLRYRVSSYMYFARNLHRYPPKILVQSVHRSIKRRLGLA